MSDSVIPSFSSRSYDFAEFVPAQNYIGGEWRTASTKKTIPVLNPRYAKAMSQVAMSGAEDVNAAVTASAKAQKAWALTPLRERAQVFYRLKSLMESRRDELGWLVSHENGKTFEESVAEVDKAIECVEFACAIPNIAVGEQLDVSRGVNCRTVYEPLGVVAGITPFNFPLMVPFWMIPQAIVGGNAFILKPSEQVPLAPMRVAELFKQAGLPAGIFSIVQGGKETVEALCDHPDIQAVAFVGSTRVAKLVYGRGAATGKSMLCLGGAKNHLIVVPDADPALTADNVLASFTGCAGQRCMAASVLLAVGDVEPIIQQIAKKAAALTVGKDIGAITNSESVTRITGYIDGAEKAGAKVLVDGRGKSGGEGGYWVGPTILDGVGKDAPAATEEIFGPVLSILRVKTLDEAIDIENANPYGNAAAIYTTSGEAARAVAERVNAGMVGINIGVPVPREPFSFGGFNQSKFGHGDITGWDGYRFWTRLRKITMKWAPQKDSTWMS